MEDSDTTSDTAPSTAPAPAAKRGTKRVREADEARRKEELEAVREQAEAEKWPDEKRLTKELELCRKEVEEKTSVHITASRLWKDHVKPAFLKAGFWQCGLCHTAKKQGHFSKNKDGTLIPRCKACHDNKSLARAQRETKRERQEARHATIAAAPEVQDLNAIEDTFAQWMKPLLEAEGFEVQIMPEFRRADVLVRRAAWPGDRWVRLQLKTDGGFQMDGETPKVVTRAGHWLNTFGYGALKGDGATKKVACPAQRMLVVLGMRRGRTREEVLAADYTLWCVDGGAIASDQMHSRAVVGDDTLTRASLDADCPAERRQPCAIEALVAAIDEANDPDAPFLPTTYRAAFLDVTRKTQRKELALMLCMQQAVPAGRLTFPTGNSTAIDCTFFDKDTQVKTADVADGTIRVKCHKKGFREVAYDKIDGIGQVAGGFVLKSRGRYFLFLAMLPRAALLTHKVFSDGHIAAASTTLTLHLFPEYTVWVRGKKRNQYKSWLSHPSYKFQHPVEVWPSAELPLELLEESAHLSPREDLHPSDAVIAKGRAGRGLMDAYVNPRAGPSGA